MHCSNFRANNPENAKFCNNCGANLVNKIDEFISCPNCNEQSPINTKFCNNCGFSLGKSKGISEQSNEFDKLKQYIPKQLFDKLQNSNKTTSSERRVVTILFCDVTGSTAAAETLDPEEWVIF